MGADPVIPVIEPTPEIRELIALAKVPIRFAWEHKGQARCVLLSDRAGVWVGELRHVLPLLSNPSVREATRIFGDAFYFELKAALKPQ